MPSTSSNQADTVEDEVWAVENDGVITYRLADWTPTGVYNELASVYSAYESELLEKAKFEDHVVIGTATVQKNPGESDEVINVESNIDGHTIDYW